MPGKLPIALRQPTFQFYLSVKKKKKKKETVSHLESFVKELIAAFLTRTADR